MSTHDPINKNTAKASLQQMVSVVFARMEAKDAELKQVSWFTWFVGRKKLEIIASVRF